jgi:hypothetical protein
MDTDREKLNVSPALPMCLRECLIALRVQSLSPNGSLLTLQFQSRMLQDLTGSRFTLRPVRSAAKAILTTFFRRNEME